MQMIRALRDAGREVAVFAHGREAVVRAGRAQCALGRRLIRARHRDRVVVEARARGLPQARREHHEQRCAQDQNGGADPSSPASGFGCDSWRWCAEPAVEHRARRIDGGRLDDRRGIGRRRLDDGGGIGEALSTTTAVASGVLAASGGSERDDLHRLRPRRSRRLVGGHRAREKEHAHGNTDRAETGQAEHEPAGLARRHGQRQPAGGGGATTRASRPPRHPDGHRDRRGVDARRGRRWRCDRQDQRLSQRARIRADHRLLVTRADEQLKQAGAAAAPARLRGLEEPAPGRNTAVWSRRSGDFSRSRSTTCADARQGYSPSARAGIDHVLGEHLLHRGRERRLPPWPSCTASPQPSE